MRLDLVIKNEGAASRDILKSAPRFEDMGFDGLWLTDHVIGIPAYTMYGGYWLEILTTMSYLAATTRRIRLGTGVLVLPYRDPVLTAKMLATIDVLSDGRVDFGIGTGWALDEFQALGAEPKFESRGRATDEALAVMLKCWQGGQVAFDGTWSKIPEVEFAPTPVQKPRIPIWVGARGTAAAPLNRAARFADIWHPVGLSPDELKAGGEKLDDLAGRKIPRSIRIAFESGTEPAVMVDRLQAFRDVGCVQAAVEFRSGSQSEFLSSAEAFMAAADKLHLH
jgi:probable F420-dependent oxidoreductase